MNNFTSRLITAVLAAGTVTAKHPMLSQPLHVDHLRHGTNGDFSIRLNRNEKTHRLRDDPSRDLTPVENAAGNRVEYTGNLYFFPETDGGSVQTIEVSFTTD